MLRRKTLMRILNDKDSFLVLNDEGKEIVLNELQQLQADFHQRQLNALGYGDISVSTLTQVLQKVVEQKFFEVPPADYIPIRVGEGAWAAQLLTYRSFLLADDFTTGVINTGNNNGRLASADAGVDSVLQKIFNWAKEITWTLFELRIAARAGNFDIVTSKEKARKKNWDLGIQKIAFLGMPGDNQCKGLYTLDGITTDTATITKKIGSMTPAELKTFVAGMLSGFRTANQRTSWPDRFIIPESDYLGLAAPSNPDFPIKSVFEVMRDTFKEITGNQNFQILTNPYGDAAYNGLGVQKYVLLKYDEDSIRMDIPVDYNNTSASTVNGFQYQNVGYGQFTGVMAFRPKDVYYFQYTPS